MAALGLGFASVGLAIHCLPEALDSFLLPPLSSRTRKYIILKLRPLILRSSCFVWSRLYALVCWVCSEEQDINPANQMKIEERQRPSEGQTLPLPTDRVKSSIPKAEFTPGHQEAG